MKWSKEQVEELKEMCIEGKSNKEIAEKLGCSLTDVYGKRSQLGITIDKVKSLQAVQYKKQVIGLSSELSKAFDKLYEVILIDMGRDRTSLVEAQLLSALSELLTTLEENFNFLIKEAK